MSLLHAWNSPSNQDPDFLKEDSHGLWAIDMKNPRGPQSSIGMSVGDVERPKLFARDSLAALSRRRISLSKIKFTKNSSQDGGGYADVQVATLIHKGCSTGNPEKIAVKKLRFILGGDMTEEKFFRLFVNELHLLDQMSHPNIVEILGFVEDIEKRIAWLIFPWEDNGNLREFLRSGKWEIPERVSLIQDVALGLDYLHNHQPPICHGDLKSLNILVNSSKRAIITDFGSARIVQEAQELRDNLAPPPVALAYHFPPTKDQHPQLSVTASNTMLTLTGPTCSFRWAPPEALNGEPLALASDIWALGWIAWETITDCYPFEGFDGEFEVTMRIVQGQLPLIYDHHQLSRIHHLCSIMERCWSPDPKQRPSSTECRKFLEWIPSAIPIEHIGEDSMIRSATLLLQLGEIHRLQNRCEEASKLYLQGLAIAQITRDQSTAARLCVQLAENYRAGSQYTKAKTSYSRALGIYRSIGNDLGRASVLSGLGHVHREHSKFAEAEASYTQALVVYESARDDLGRANALDGLGDVQRQRCKYVEAETSYSQALVIYPSIGNNLGQANALNGLGDVQRELSKYIQAEESYTRALVIYKSIGNELGRANALDGLGDVQREHSKYDEAELSYSQALSIYKSIGDHLGQANTLLGLGDVQGQRSKHAEAELSYLQALVIYKNVGNDLGHGNALDGLGDVQREQSKFVQAEASYIQAFEIFDRIGNDLGRANALDGLWDMQRQRSKYDEGLDEGLRRHAHFFRIMQIIQEDSISRGSSEGLACVQTVCGGEGCGATAAQLSGFSVLLLPAPPKREGNEKPSLAALLNAYEKPTVHRGPQRCRSCAQDTQHTRTKKVLSWPSTIIFQLPSTSPQNPALSPSASPLSAPFNRTNRRHRMARSSSRFCYGDNFRLLRVSRLLKGAKVHRGTGPGQMPRLILVATRRREGRQIGGKHSRKGIKANSQRTCPGSQSGGRKQVKGPRRNISSRFRYVLAFGGLAGIKPLSPQVPVDYPIESFNPGKFNGQARSSSSHGLLSSSSSTSLPYDVSSESGDDDPLVGLRPLLESNNEEDVYDLFAVRECVKGHRYRVFAKDPVVEGQGKWVLFDAATGVSQEVKELREVVTPNADLLLYRRREQAETNSPLLSPHANPCPPLFTDNQSSRSKIYTLFVQKPICGSTLLPFLH